jgi:hypothetical protein
MRTFLGMILGCLLTVAVLYVHDTMATSTVTTGPAASQVGQIVNWDVAAHEWGRVKEGAHTAWLRLTGNVG